MRTMHSMEGKLNTIVAQAGLMFLPELDVWSIGLDGRTRVRELGECEALSRRWFTPSKQYTAMGSPITEAVIDSCCGVTCCMSRGALGAFRSSRRSVCHHCGNTMHLNSVGAAKVVLYLVLPCLGETGTQNRAGKTLAAHDSFRPFTKRCSAHGAHEYPKMCWHRDSHVRNHQHRHQHHNHDGEANSIF